MSSGNDMQRFAELQLQNTNLTLEIVKAKRHLQELTSAQSPLARLIPVLFGTKQIHEARARVNTIQEQVGAVERELRRIASDTKR